MLIMTANKNKTIFVVYGIVSLLLESPQALNCSEEFLLIKPLSSTLPQ